MPRVPRTKCPTTCIPASRARFAPPSVRRALGAKFSAARHYKGTRVSECGTHRIRSAMLRRGTGNDRFETSVVYLTDSRQHERPQSPAKNEARRGRGEQADAALSLHSRESTIWRMHTFRSYFQDDLVRLGNTIQEYDQRSTFMDTIANNANLHWVTPDERVAVKLYDPGERAWIERLESGTGIECAQVMPANEECFRCGRRLGSSPYKQTWDSGRGAYRCRGLVCPFELGAGMHLVSEEDGTFRTWQGAKQPFEMGTGVLVTDANGRVILGSTANMAEPIVSALTECLRSRP